MELTVQYKGIKSHDFLNSSTQSRIHRGITHFLRKVHTQIDLGLSQIYSPMQGTFF